MGGGRFDAGAYARFAASTAGRSTAEIYTSNNLNKNLDPKGVKMRESRDSADNPNSTPIIVGLDVTGSMGILADNIAREGLGTLFSGIYDRKSVSDPHIMFMGIGDVTCDQAPLQVSQFEADKRIIEQITQLWLEHGGGGNMWESYNLPWYFAARHTAHDSIEKRGKRGYLFTVGDEDVPESLHRGQIERFIGDKLQADMTTVQALHEAQRLYDIFHVVITQGTNFRERGLEAWKRLLGQRVIRLDDYTKLAQTIVSAIEVSEGHDAEVSANAWGDGAAIYHAVKSIPRSHGPKLIGAR